MLKKGIILLVFLSSIIIFTYSSFYFRSNQNSEINFSVIKNGDLILRCGRSTESYTVYLADKNSEFTHIGIISVENKIPYVIHAVPHKNKYIKKETLKDFLKPKFTSKFALYRNNLNESYLEKIVEEANLFYHNKYIFDSEYDLKTKSKLYCTELIINAYKNIGISLKLNAKKFSYVFGKHSIIFPSEFTKPPFKKITIN